eukprot:g18027.t1
MRVLRHTDKFHERLETLYQHFLLPKKRDNQWTEATFGFKLARRLNGTTWFLHQRFLFTLAFSPAVSSLSYLTPIQRTRAETGDRWKIEEVARSPCSGG